MPTESTGSSVNTIDRTTRREEDIEEARKRAERREPRAASRGRTFYGPNVIKSD